VVMGGCLLHPKLTADVSDTAHAYGLRIEDVDLDEVSGCELLKPGPVPSSLCSARFHQRPSFISMGDSYCDTTGITYNNYSSDNRQWQCYLAIKFI